MARWLAFTDENFRDAAVHESLTYLRKKASQNSQDSAKLVGGTRSGVFDLCCFRVARPRYKYKSSGFGGPLVYIANSHSTGSKALNRSPTRLQSRQGLEIWTSTLRRAASERVSACGAKRSRRKAFYDLLGLGRLGDWAHGLQTNNSAEVTVY